MSDYNSTITDRELRELLNTILLSEGSDAPATNKLMEMEANILRGSEPLLVLSLAKENALIKKLDAKFGGMQLAKWLFSGIALVTAISLLFYIQTHPLSIQQTASVQNTDEHAGIVQGREEVIMDPALLESTSPIPGQKPLINMLPLVSKDSAIAPNAWTMAADNDGPQDPAPLAATTRLSDPVCEAAMIRHTGINNATHADTIFAGVKRLEVIGTYCDINVKAVSGDLVVFNGDIKVEKKGLFVNAGKYEIRYERHDDVLKVWVEHTSKSNVFLIGSLNIEGFLNFEVPAKTAINLKNYDGDITVAGVNENVIAESSYGSACFSNITGNIKTKCASGSVKLSDINGDLDLYAAYGNVNLKNMRGNVKLTASSGNVVLDEMKGNHCTIMANYGNVRLTDIVTDLSVQSTSGDIYLTKMNGNSWLSSNYGNQHLTDVKGDISSASSSGSIELIQSKGNLNLRTTYGDVELVDCNGNIKVGLESGSIKGKSITLTDSLNLRTNYGNIRMSLNNGLNDLSFNLETTYGRIKINKEGENSTSEGGKILIKKGRVWVSGYTRSGDQSFE